MSNTLYLSNQLLIAMPALGDPRFERSVVLVCEHNREGAMGIVINKAMQLSLADILNYIGHLSKDTDDRALSIPIFWGGPLDRNKGFIVHRSIGHWSNTQAIGESLAVTTSQDILHALASGRGPVNESLVCFGCARWYPGQLEQEIAENVWLTMPASPAVLFNCPTPNRWTMAAAQMGIDFNYLSYDVGHA
ncbi:MAG: YqgE/AlgH family protein [Gammaproteobacteria bacterium]